MLSLKDFKAMKIENLKVLVGGYAYTTLDGKVGGDTIDDHGNFWINHEKNSERRCKNEYGHWGPC